MHNIYRQKYFNWTIVKARNRRILNRLCYANIQPINQSLAWVLALYQRCTANGRDWRRIREALECGQAALRRFALYVTRTEKGIWVVRSEWVSVVRAVDQAAVRNGYSQRLIHNNFYNSVLINTTTTFSLRLSVSLSCLLSIHETESCKI